MGSAWQTHPLAAQTIPKHRKGQGAQEGKGQTPARKCIHTGGDSVKWKGSRGMEGAGGNLKVVEQKTDFRKDMESWNI